LPSFLPWPSRTRLGCVLLSSMLTGSSDVTDGGLDGN
jgi:hypothetical protein